MNMRIKPLVFAFLIMAVGCSKDRSVDDYKRGKLQQSVSELQAVQGRYSGVLISKRTGARLGALELTLTASTEPVQGNDESTPSARPIMLTSVQFQSGSHMVIAGRNSYYDSSTGQFTTQITIPRNGTDYSVFVNGRINGGALDGSLSAQGYEDEGGTIQLSKNGKQLDQLVKENKFDTSPLFSQGSFAGNTTFTEGVVKPVRLIILKPQSSSEEDFLNLLVPVKPVLATLNYGNGARITFSSGQLDLRTGRLTGQTGLSLSGSTPATASSTPATAAGTATTGGSVQMTMVCQMNTGNQGFDCTHATGSAQGTVAESHVEPKAANTPDEPDPSGPRDSITRNYAGLAMFEPGKQTKVQLSTVYPARTRTEEIVELFLPNTEKILPTVLLNPSARIGASFPLAKWDTVNGTLDGASLTSIPNQTVTLTVSCRNFFFRERPYDFTCSYYSSLTGVIVPVRFQAR